MAREQISRSVARSEHIVHFFDDEQARVNTVSTFLAGALNRNATALVIARPQLWASVADALGEQPGTPASPSRLVVLDAHTILMQLMHRGAIDPERFDRVVTPFVRDLAAASPLPVTAYGEMVDLLAEEGDFVAAQQLESCWNALGRHESMTLLCGYTAAHFAFCDRSVLTAICDAHTRVHTDAPDALGQWIVSGCR